MKWLINILKKRSLITAIGFICLLILVAVLGLWLGWGVTIILLSEIIVLFLWILSIMYARLRANQGAALLEKSINAQADEQLLGMRPDKKAEIEQLKQQLAVAIESLKKSRLGKSRSGKAALYALPWYMFIGPPAAGKTTAIVNSGLEFPLGSNRIRGVGGTRNCDWFFSNSAILLDTAGRYTTEDEDREEWLAFLQMLKKYRSKTAINGVIVGISIADLINAAQSELEYHAATIRNRIDELIKNLGTRFPVYLVFTKCDLIHGFVEFFEDLSRREREQIWGCTLQPKQYEQSRVQEVFEEEFTLMLNSLEDLRFNRLNNPLKREVRRSVYVFPLEFGSLKENLSHFVEKLFQQNPYQENPIFRGFYFTSGTQEGMPIDRVIQSIARQFNLAPEISEQFSPEMETKSYFIKELFTDQIIPDQFMAGQTSRAATRTSLFRLGVAALAVILLSLFLLGSFQGYFRSKMDLSALEKAARESRLVNWQADENVMKNFEAVDRLGKVIQTLEDKHENPSLLNFGFTRAATVLPSARTLYFQKASGFINRYLYSELERRLQNAAHYDKEKVYDYLRSYLLMGMEVTRLDTANQKFLRRQLNALLEERFYQFMSQENLTRLKPTIEQQITYFVDGLGKEGVQGFENNTQLIGRVRTLLYEAPSIHGVYVRLRREAEGRLNPYTVEQALGGRSGGLIDGTTEVPGFFTRVGWQNYVREAFERESENPGQVDWVIDNQEVKLPPSMQNPEKMEAELTRLYFQEYVEVWWRFLRGLTYRSGGNLARAVDDLRTLGDFIGSPLVTLMNSVAEQTTFSDEMSQGLTDKAGSLVDKVGKKLGLSKGTVSGQFQAPLHPVDKQFTMIHELSPLSPENNGKSEKLAAILNQYTMLSDALQALRDDPGARSKEYAVKILQQGSGELPEALRTVRSNLSAFDLTIRRSLFERPIQATWDIILAEARRNLNDLWQQQVYEPFRTTLQTYYPFDPRGPDAPVIDVERFFQPQTGTFWAFYEKELQTFIRVDTWKPYTWEGRGIQPSNAAVRAFNKARRLSEAIFNHGVLQIEFSLQPGLPVRRALEEEAPLIEQVCLSVDGKEDCYRMGRQYWIDFSWPGVSGAPGAQLKVYTPDGSLEPLQFEGSWGFFRLLEPAGINRLSSSVYQVQWDMSRKNRYQLFINYQLRARSAYNPFANIGEFFLFDCPNKLN